MKKHYENLDGIRTIAAIGIILMHIQANGGYDFSDSGYLLGYIIPQLGILVRLFFILSGFAMCCGYYEAFRNNNVDIEKFYIKRYKKNLPFFAVLVLIYALYSILFNSSLTKVGVIFESFADVTMLFGFLPNGELTIVGLGWTLGVIFAFYILFPFFVFLLWNKKRAWITLIAALIMNISLDYYFLIEGSTVRSNLLYQLCYFVLGGIIYLYRDGIANTVVKNRIIGWITIIAGVVITFVFPFPHLRICSSWKSLAGFALIIVGCLMPADPVLSNKFTRFISKLSLEIYLSHILIYRIVSKLFTFCGITNGIWSYFGVVIFTIVSTVLFSKGVFKLFDYIRNVRIYMQRKRG